MPSPRRRCCRRLGRSARRDARPVAANDGLTIVSTVLMGSVGFVVIGKQPRNAVGWLFVAAAMSGLVDVAARRYLVLDYRQHSGNGCTRLGGGRVAARGGDPAVPRRACRRSCSSRTVRCRRLVGAARSGSTRHWQRSSRSRSSPGRRSRAPSRPASRHPGRPPTATRHRRGDGLAAAGLPRVLARLHRPSGPELAPCERRAAGPAEMASTGAFLCVVACVHSSSFGDSARFAATAADLSVLAIAALPVAIGIGILDTGSTRSTG